MSPGQYSHCDVPPESPSVDVLATVSSAVTSAYAAQHAVPSTVYDVRSPGVAPAPCATDRNASLVPLVPVYSVTAWAAVSHDPPGHAAQPSVAAVALAGQRRV